MSLPVDLFFTQTDCNCDEEAGHDPDCDYANEYEALGLMSPRRVASQSPVPDRYDSLTIETDDDNSNQTKVRFHDFMKVVLIPTKEEFKRANCDLWWKRHDFATFQRDASSEIRIYSLIQNVNLHEAKRVLYQPQPGELDQSDPNNNTSPALIQDIDQVMEHLHQDSLYDLNQSNHIFRGRTESEESVEEKPKEIREVASEASDLSAASNSNTLNEKPPSIVPPEGLHEPLNFCVPISDPVPASNNSRMSKYRNTIASASILAAMGLFSFAAPILGFYFLSSQR